MDAARLRMLLVAGEDGYPLVRECLAEAGSVPVVPEWAPIYEAGTPASITPPTRARIRVRDIATTRGGRRRG